MIMYGTWQETGKTISSIAKPRLVLKCNFLFIAHFKLQIIHKTLAMFYSVDLQLCPHVLRPCCSFICFIMSYCLRKYLDIFDN